MSRLDYILQQVRICILLVILKAIKLVDTFICLILVEPSHRVLLTNRIVSPLSLSLSLSLSLLLPNSMD